MNEPSIEMSREGDGTRLRLPPRTAEAGRVAGCGLTAAGLLGTVFMLFWMLGPIAMGLRRPGSPDWIFIGFGLLGLPGLAATAAMLAAGLSIRRGDSRTEVVVRPGELRIRECFGALRWTRRKTLPTQVQLLLKDATKIKAHPSGHSLPPALQNLQPLGCSLQFMDANGRPVLVSMGYSREILEELAEAIARALPGSSWRNPTGSPSASVTIVEADGSVIDETEAVKPPSSDIILEESAASLGFIIPPAGLVKGSRGLFVFSIVWLAFCLPFLFAVPTVRSADLVVLPLMLSIFVVVGIGMLLISIQLGRRRTLLALAGGQLVVRRTGPLRSKEWRWAAADIEKIVVGPSGVEVNDKPVMALQVFAARSKGPVNLLTERSDAELHWMAGRLRNRLS